MNIKLMLEQMAHAGFTDSAIARELSDSGDPVATSLVNRWRNGVYKRISYERYLRVAAIHSRVLGVDANHDQNSSVQNKNNGIVNE